MSLLERANVSSETLISMSVLNGLLTYEQAHRNKSINDGFNYSQRIEKLLYLISQRKDTDERLKKTIEKLLEQGK